MSQSFFSPDWPQFAELKPSLRPHLKIHRQVYRERIWHLVEDESNGRQHRLDKAAWEFTSQMDGEKTIHQIWNQMVEKLKSDAPNQTDVIQTISSLHQSDLILVDSSQDTEELFYRSEKRKQVRRQSLVNPLAIKTPLFNPSKLLDKIQPKTHWIYHWVTGLSIVILAAIAGIAAFENWQEITVKAATSLPSSQFWIITWFAYPLVKFVHEIAHALTVRHWGGKVHEMGISLLVFMPVPYVNASAANLFSDKKARMLVSAAGIITEAVIASIAILVWLNISDGWIKNISFVVMTISGISTVLFNANPLIKFDGYHFVCDWLEIPDLDSRSKKYWKSFSKRHLLKVPDSTRLDLSKGEKTWLVSYLPASWLYRWVILLVIATWLADISLVLSILVAVLFLKDLLFKPLIHAIKYLWQSTELSNTRARSLLSTATLLTTVIVAITMVPVPFSTLTQGIGWTPDESKIRASANGFIETILVDQGEHVDTGKAIIRLKNDLLFTKKKQLEAQLLAIKARLKAKQQNDRSAANELDLELQTVGAELALVTQQTEDLTIKAQTSGRVILPDMSDLQDRYLRQGDNIGYVLGDSTQKLRAVIKQSDLTNVNQYPGAISARFGGSGNTTFSAKIIDIHPSATYSLPSAALSYTSGGMVLTEPEDQEALTSTTPIFVVDLTIQKRKPEFIGNRVWLRFDHGSKPLLQQWTIHWKQLLIQHFSSQA